MDEMITKRGHALHSILYLCVMLNTKGRRTDGANKVTDASSCMLLC